MPFTKSGLWIPREPQEKTWKAWIKKNSPLFVSVLALLMSIVSLWQNTRQSRIAQRAYLSSSFALPNSIFLRGFYSGLPNTIMDINVTLENLGSTPAQQVQVFIEQIYQLRGEITSEERMTHLEPVRDLQPREKYIFSGHHYFDIARTYPKKDGFIVSLIEHIEFEDVFGQYHEERICQRVTGVDNYVHIQGCLDPAPKNWLPHVQRWLTHPW